MHFNTHTTGKSKRNRNLIKNYYNKRSILASGLKTIFLPDNPNERCDRLKLLKPEKRASKNFDVINQEKVAIVDKSLEYKCITPTQHKKKY